MASSCPQPVLAATLLRITLTLSFLLLLQQQLVHGDSQNITKPSLGGSFTPLDNTFWVSPNHIFALSFLQLPTPVGFRQSFALSIFYFQLPQPQKTVVWTANQGSLLTRNSSLLLTEEGNLVLTDGGTPVWETNTSGRGVASASLTDEGNFILLDRQSSHVWESWKFPTDTFLPGQSLYGAGAGMRLEASRGRYFLTMQGDDNLVLYFNGAATAKWVPYYASNTVNQNYTRLYFDASGRLLLLDDSTTPARQHVILVSSSNQPLLRRIVMGNEGILTLFDLSADGMSWSADQQFPHYGDMPCIIIGRCGFYGICGSNDSCSCPPGFEFVNVADTAEGCRPTHPMDCALGTQMVKLQGVQYKYLEYDETPSTELDCVKNCTSECLCAAAEYDGLTCRLRLVGQILGGRLESGFVTYLKVSAYSNATIDPPPAPLPPSSSSSTGERRIISDRAAIAIVIPLVFVATVGLLHLAVWFYKRRKEKRKQDIDDVGGEGDEFDGRPLLDGPVHYSYKELQAATNGFKEVLGRGGFGPVFKGVLAGGIPVAVKKLEARNFGQKQFKAEVRTIGNLHHVNLVRLRGYCVRGQDRLLVYDYMEKGSLDKYLFARDVVEGDGGGNNMKEGSRKRPSTKPPLLDWEKRFKIALGTARAMKYLHEECEPVIVHCDIKPENILLDDEFCAKVSDFGMAQLVGGELTGSITTVRGTFGYMAPEWMSSTRISSKADVYSFGMVLLVLMSGRKAIDVSVEDSSMVELASWAYTQLLEKHNSVVLVDPRLVSATASSRVDFPSLHDNPEFLRTAYVSFWCIQKDPSLRPSMGTALQMLEGLLPIPSPPYPF